MCLSEELSYAIKVNSRNCELFLLKKNVTKYKIIKLLGFFKDINKLFRINKKIPKKILDCLSKI